MEIKKAKAVSRAFMRYDQMGDVLNDLIVERDLHGSDGLFTIPLPRAFLPVLIKAAEGFMEQYENEIEKL